VTWLADTDGREKAEGGTRFDKSTARWMLDDEKEEVGIFCCRGEKLT
jgi:hypothetical protein